jgi:signal transduction histidine kinase
MPTSKPRLPGAQDQPGMAAADGASHRSIGLAGMRERAHPVGGGVSIPSAAGAGTTVLVQIPWRGAPSV